MKKSNLLISSLLIAGLLLFAGCKEPDETLTPDSDPLFSKSELTEVYDNSNGFPLEDGEYAYKEIMSVTPYNGTETEYYEFTVSAGKKTVTKGYESFYADLSPLPKDERDMLIEVAKAEGAEINGNIVKQYYELKAADLASAWVSTKAFDNADEVSTNKENTKFYCTDTSKVRDLNGDEHIVPVKYYLLKKSTSTTTKPDDPVDALPTVNLPKAISFTDCTQDCDIEDFATADGEWTIVLDEEINFFAKFGKVRCVINAEAVNNTYDFMDGKFYIYFESNQYDLYDSYNDKLEAFKSDMEYHNIPYEKCGIKDNYLIAYVGNIPQSSLDSFKDFLDVTALNTWTYWSLKTNSDKSKYKISFEDPQKGKYAVYLAK